jgi:hypothetical protein
MCRRAVVFTVVFTVCSEQTVVNCGIEAHWSYHAVAQSAPLKVGRDSAAYRQWKDSE